MKILIYFACCFCAGAVQTGFRQFGIVLGAIPTVLLYLVAFTAAKVLCEKWDLRDAKKKAAKEGISVIEYAKKGLKADFLEKLDETMNTKTPKEINKFLKKSLNDGTITKQQYIVFLKEYDSQK